MQKFLSRCKKQVWKLVASLCFYSPILRWMNRFSNYFQFRKESRFAFPFIKKRQFRNFQILVYHRVNNEYDPFFPAVPTEVFERQMEYLATHFHVCSLENVIEMAKKKDIPDNTVVITFDDGYKDNYWNAFPILKKLSLPATIFLATDCIGSGKVLWHDVVFSAFRETQEPFLVGYGINLKDYPLRTIEEKRFAHGQVLNFLRALEDHERPFWIQRLVEKLKVIGKKDAADLMLNWEEVRIMQQQGISFGSHTVTHPILSRLPADKVREEVLKSKKTIEEQLGVPVRTFAYPSGRKQDFTEITKNILKEAGYDCAVTMVFGTNEYDQDLFELRRGMPWENHLPTFAVKLSWYKLYPN